LHLTAVYEALDQFIFRSCVLFDQVRLAARYARKTIFSLFVSVVCERVSAFAREKNKSERGETSEKDSNAFYLVLGWLRGWPPGSQYGASSPFIHPSRLKAI
jgi:hypothetical protein